VDSVRPAYDLYREACRWMPIGLHSQQVPNLEARGHGFGICLFGPFHLPDLGFIDTNHARNYFAPYNLIAEDTLQPLVESTTRVTDLLGRAWEHVRMQPSNGKGGEWEKAVFEIHWRSFRAFRNYVRLASAKWRHLHGELPPAKYQQMVQAIAADELDNLDEVEAWNEKHPGQLGNPCHRIRGHLESAWPDADFTGNLFAPKRRSLEFLVNEFDPAELIPVYVIQGTSNAREETSEVLKQIF